MSYHHCLKKLNNLSNKLVHNLEFLKSKLVLNSLFKISVIDEWHINSWEKISDDTIEEWEIVLQELWNIGISHSSNQYNVLLS